MRKTTLCGATLVVAVLGLASSAPTNAQTTPATASAGCGAPRSYTMTVLGTQRTRLGVVLDEQPLVSEGSLCLSEKPKGPFRVQGFNGLAFENKQQANRFVQGALYGVAKIPPKQLASFIGAPKEVFDAMVTARRDASSAPAGGGEIASWLRLTTEQFEAITQLRESGVTSANLAGVIAGVASMNRVR